jgi:hypothetical protein
MEKIKINIVEKNQEKSSEEDKIYCCTCGKIMMEEKISPTPIELLDNFDTFEYFDGEEIKRITRRKIYLKSNHVYNSDTGEKNYNIVLKCENGHQDSKSRIKGYFSLF